MPQYKDEATGTWYVKCYYINYIGEKKQKFKRGFKRQKDAKEWERNFLENFQKDLDMSFPAFVNIYLEDISTRYKLSTLKSKENIIKTKILPYFNNFKISQIKATDVRRWQNQMLNYENEKGIPYSQTYLRSMHKQLSAIFNYGIKYYDLKENPCLKAGSIGEKNADEMLFWTKEEFETFITYTKDRIETYTSFEILYYTGIRVGELLSLTPSDIDLENYTLSISKSLQRYNKKDIITTPKTKKSNRIINIPTFLCNEIQTYMCHIYGLSNTDRLFPFTSRFLLREMDKYCRISGVKRIRIHDLRHSHASLLIELGFSPLLIAERLGHDKVETTINIYSHLYPNKQNEVVEKLDSLRIVSN